MLRVAHGSISYRITHELLGQLAFRNESFRSNPVSVETMRELLELIRDGSLTGAAQSYVSRML
jgi:aspartyl-tRNA(Asn)/glutamyl-tRNA(Gln) amidotransferase subunit B